MPTDYSRTLQVFVASPGDVGREREIVFDVIKEINTIFANLSTFITPSIRLNLLAWERNVYPDGGRPQPVIDSQLRIEECDLFIAILWKRFGTPPGMASPVDGRIYESGTESEIDQAFQIKKRTGGKKPVIMLYRKMDSYPPLQTSEDLHQASLVQNFFTECEPNGKHPALIYQFKQEIFRTAVRDHLLLAINSMFKEVDISNSTTSASTELAGEPEEEADLLRQWLEKRKLKENPFRNLQAEDEENLTPYFVRFQRLREWGLQEVQSGRGVWLVYGKEGSGKTALRRFLSSRTFPLSSQSDTLCIEIDSQSFKTLEAQSESDPNQFQRLFIQQVYDLASKASKQPNRLWMDLSDTDDAGLLLSRLVDAVRRTGFERLLCLTDPFVGSISNRVSEKEIGLLAGLIAFPSIAGIHFRFFIPQHLKTSLYRQPYDLSRCHAVRIEWAEPELRELIRRRMLFASKDPASPYQSFGQLCEEKGGFASEIDARISELAEGNPRAVIWLAHRLIKRHCQSASPPYQIPITMWDQVQTEWFSADRNRILGPEGSSESFWVTPQDVFFRERRVLLSKRSKALLRRLVEIGDLCSKDLLIQAGWNVKDSSGVSESALREAMRRLKIELSNKNGIDPRWIKTVHGEGYRLEEPQEETLAREVNHER